MPASTTCTFAASPSNSIEAVADPDLDAGLRRRHDEHTAKRQVIEVKVPSAAAVTINEPGSHVLTQTFALPAGAPFAYETDALDTSERRPQNVDRQRNVHHLAGLGDLVLAPRLDPGHPFSTPSR